MNIHHTELRSGVSQLYRLSETGEKTIETVTATHIATCEEAPAVFNTLFEPILLTKEMIHKFDYMSENKGRQEHLRRQAFSINHNIIRIHDEFNDVVIAEGIIFLHQFQDLMFALGNQILQLEE